MALGHRPGPGEGPCHSRAMRSPGAAVGNGCGDSGLKGFQHLPLVDEMAKLRVTTCNRASRWPWLRSSGQRRHGRSPLKSWPQRLGDGTIDRKDSLAYNNSNPSSQPADAWRIRIKTFCLITDAPLDLSKTDHT